MANPNRRTSSNKLLTFVKLTGIPGPRGLKYWRWVRFFQQNILGAFTKVHQEFGAIASFPWPMNSVIIYSPEMIRKVLVEEQRSYIKGEQIEELKAVVGDGLATNNDQESWLWHRSILGREFNSKAIARFMMKFHQVTEQQLAKLKTNQKIDICEEFKLLTFAMAAETFLGANLSETEARKISQAVDYTAEVTYKRIFQFFPLPYWAPTPTYLKFKQHYTVLNETVQKLIQAEKKLEKNNEAQSVLARLVHAIDPDTGKRMSDDEIRDEVLTLMLAGHETTAHTLTWIVGLLARYPEYQEKLREEIETSIELDYLKRPWLMSIIREAMRLYPAFPVLSRKARVATELGPYKIAAQTNVVIPIYVMQRSEKHWPNALEFRPERFFDDEAEKSYAFLPFSKGPRRCIGELFAMAEISCVLVQFYKRYKVATITELPQDIAHVSLKPLGSLWVQLRER